MYTNYSSGKINVIYTLIQALSLLGGGFISGALFMYQSDIFESNKYWTYTNSKTNNKCYVKLHIALV